MAAELELVKDDDPPLEGDVVECEPLSERAAKALDKRIRSASVTVTDNMNRLVDLLEEAVKGEIHAALGFTSWTAYVKDAVQITVSDRIERKALVSLMSGQGMSQRAIAGTLGVSQKTVDRDLDDADESDDSAVTGLDGKTYKKSALPKTADDNVIDDEPEPAAKRTSLTKDFDDEVYQLENDVVALRENIINDERFTKSQKRLAKSAAATRLYNVVTDLEEVLATIMGEEFDADESVSDDPLIDFG